MNSTAGPGPLKVRKKPLAVIAASLLVAITTLAGTLAHAADEPMPRPPQLERDVQFWIRVYTQIDTNAGYLHDQYNLGAVYDTLHFESTIPSERQHQVDEARERVA